MQNENLGKLNYKAEYYRLLGINEALSCKCEMLRCDLETLNQDNKRLEEQYKGLENTLLDAEKEIAFLKGQVEAFRFCTKTGCL